MQKSELVTRLEKDLKKLERTKERMTTEIDKEIVFTQRMLREARRRNGPAVKKAAPKRGAPKQPAKKQAAGREATPRAAAAAKPPPTPPAAPEPPAPAAAEKPAPRPRGTRRGCPHRVVRTVAETYDTRWTPRLEYSHSAGCRG